MVADWYERVKGIWKTGVSVVRYKVAGVLEKRRGDWDARRVPVKLAALA
jgi:hypothetical protein